MRDYGGELRSLRRRTGFTLEKVEEAMPHWPVDKLSRIERGRQEPKCSEYDELKNFYRANGAGIQRIITYFRRDGGKQATLIVR